MALSKGKILTGRTADLPTYPPDKKSLFLDVQAEKLYGADDTLAWFEITGGGGGGGGEANTASNVGTAGTGIFDAKVGVDLQFRKLNALSTKLSVALDAPNKKIDIDFGTVNFSHLSDKVHDHSNNANGGVLGTSAISDDAVTFAKIQNISTNKLLGRSSAGSGDIESISLGANLSLSGGTLDVTGLGEVNTASNVGVTGVGVFKTKAGVDLQFKKLNVGSSKITIVDDGINDEIDIDLGTVNFSDLNTKTHTHADAANGGTLAASVIATGQLALARGGTGSDFSTGQTQNQVFASPDGSSGAVGLRTLVAGDIPNLNASKITAGEFATARIADNAITYAKIQNVTADRLLGRSTAGVGIVEEIQIGSGLSLSGGTLSASGGSGEANTASNIGVGGIGVFKQKTGVNLEFRNINAGSAKVTVALDGANNEVDIDLGTVNFSDLNTKTHTHADAANGGTLDAGVIATGQLAKARGGTGADFSAGQTQNRVFASPDGVDGAVSLRSLVANDIPSLAASKITSGQLTVARGGTGADLSATGGASQYLKQTSVGGNVSVGAIVDGDLPATLAGKTLTTPTIASFVNAGHSHQDAAGGGTLDTSAIASGTLGKARGGTGADFSTGQPQNQVFASPDGAAGAVGLRALVANDIPNLAASKITSGQLVLARGGVGADLSATGGAGQYLKQVSVGATITVGTIPDGDLPTTLAGKTLTTPTIADFTNAAHGHQNAAGGGSLDGAAIGSGTVAAARLGLMTGDSGSGGAKGAVPAPAAGDATAGKFLKADGTWATVTASATQVDRTSATAGDFVAREKLTADTTYRVSVGLDGSSNPIIQLGPGGAAALDIQLKRTGAKVLTLDDNAGAAATLTLAGLGTLNWGGAGLLDANNANLRLPARTTALTATEGHAGWRTDVKDFRLYDAVRERSLQKRGWAPFAYPIDWIPTAAYTTALALAANGGSIAIPILVTTHMLLEGVSVRNTDTTLARTWGWDLYEQYQNSGNASENTLTRIANSTANETFTATAASTRTIAAASAPVYIGPGVYWLVVQNRHATNTFGLGSTAASAPAARNRGQTKTTINPNGATLNFVAATWTKVTAIYCVWLSGREFGQTTAF